MKEETRDLIVPIRMNFTEKNKIERRAKLAGKNFSTFVRSAALGCEIKERPDRESYKIISKNMNSFIKVLNELERIAYSEQFIDERILNEELEKWKEFRKLVAERYL